MRDTFGFRLKKFRTMLDLTQQQLAEKSGVSRKQISDFEMDVQTNPRKQTIFKLANALNIDSEKLISTNPMDDVLELSISNAAHEKLSKLAELNNRSIEDEATELLKKALLIEENSLYQDIKNNSDQIVIDKSIFNELTKMRADLRNMSKIIYDGLAPMYEDIKILPCAKPTNKPIQISNIVRLNFTFGESNNSRFGNFKVIEFNGFNGKAELVEVIFDEKYFEDYDDRLGKVYSFSKEDVFDVKVISSKPETITDQDWGKP